MISGKYGMSKNGLEAMRLAVDFGWAVLPCWDIKDGRCGCGKDDCESAGKHPLGKLVRQGSLDATTDGQLITEWWIKFPTANIGVATGDPSGIWVLDLDHKADGDGIRQFAELDPSEFGYDGIDDTPKQRTGTGGRQVFFTLPDGINIRNHQKLHGCNIDVRGQGGYVVVPPSANAGGTYYWEISPHDVEVMPAADWILEFVVGNRPPTTGSCDKKLTFRFDGDLTTNPGVGEGERNQMLCRLAGQHLAAHGVDNDLLPLALAWAERCRPPLDQKQVHKTVVALAEKHVRENPMSSGKGGTPNIYALSTVESAPVEWLWQDRFPKKLCIVSGNAGDGKTFMLIDIAARVSRGIEFPDGAACRRQKVLFATVEDGIADTIRPRAEAAGADLDNFLIFEGIRREDGEQDLLLLDRHIPILRNLLAEDPDIGLVVIDPIGAFYGQIDSHKDAEVRQVLAPLRFRRPILRFL